MAPLMQVGIQLYSLRSVLESDLDGGLTKLAALGYKIVETAGNYGLTASALRSKFDEHGLVAVSSHTGLDAILGEFDQTVADAKALGVQSVVVPWISAANYAGGWYEIADKLNEAGEKLAEVDLTVGYHNHDFELKAENGFLPLEYLVDHCIPGVVEFELDLGWIHFAGADPVEWLDKVEGSARIAHFKDFDANNQMANVGKGAMDWKAILAAAEAAGVEYAVTEHDNPVDAFVFAKESFDYLASIGVVP